MIVEDLIEQYSKMSTEKLLQRLTKIRHSRITKKEVSAKPEDRPAKKEKKAESIIDLFDQMSPEEKAKFGALLGLNGGGK